MTGLYKEPVYCDTPRDTRVITELGDEVDRSKVLLSLNFSPFLPYPRGGGGCFSLARPFVGKVIARYVPLSQRIALENAPNIFFFNRLVFYLPFFIWHLQDRVLQKVRDFTKKEERTLPEETPQG